MADTDTPAPPTEPLVRLRLFGRLVAVRGGEELDLGSTKQRAILAALGLQAGVVVSTDALIDWVWPDGDFPGSPLTSIRSYVSNLRRILGNGGVQITSQAPGYVLELADEATDVGAFGRHRDLAAAADNPAAEARHLDAALAVASRPLLPEFIYNEVAAVESRAAAERVLAARERRIELSFLLGDHPDFVAELERLVAENPMRENTTALLMRALYLSGRQGEALDAYSRLRTTLAQELGLDPTAQLQELEARIIRHDATLQPSRTRQARPTPQASGSAQAPGSWQPSGRAHPPGTPSPGADAADTPSDAATSDVPPVRRTPRAPQLVGRSSEIEQLTSLITQRRLVTLAGTGGVGKTSLALATAEAVSAEFDHGATFIELAQVSDRDGVLEAAAEAIGAREQPDLSLLDSIINYLDARQLLIVLDNCEHVLAPVVELASAIAAVDGPTILATSRETLRLPGEQLFPVEPLDPPTDGVELFVRRALERDPSFVLDDGSREPVEQICRRLDGVPLAIELAAARVRVLGPSELLARLTDRFRVLPSGMRHGRSESLRDAVQWSYDLLDESTARLFRRLSVFSGGFTLEAAAAVGADEVGSDIFDVLDLLTQLVDSSMITSRTHDGRVRFGMLETLREFGMEQLAPHNRAEEVSERHSAFFANLVFQQSADLLTSKEQEVWLQLTDEWANIRLAFERKQSIGAYDEAVDMVLALVWFSVFATRLETFGWVEELIADGAAEGHPREVALIGAQAIGCYLRLDSDTIATAERGLALDPSDPGGFNRAALAAHYLNNVFAAEDSDQLTLDWLDHVDEDDVANMLWAHGMRLFHLGSFQQGHDTSDLLAVMAGIASTTESPTAIALTSWAEGIHLASVGQDDRNSLPVWEDGLAAARQLSPDHLMAELIEGLVLYFTSPRGDLPTVAARCREAIEVASNKHHLAAQSHLFGVAAVVLTRAGDAQTGATLLGAMIGNGLRPRPLAMHFVAQALGDDHERAMETGHDLSVREAGRLAVDGIDALLASTAAAADQPRP